MSKISGGLSQKRREHCTLTGFGFFCLNQPVQYTGPAKHVNDRLQVEDATTKYTDVAKQLTTAGQDIDDVDILYRYLCPPYALALAISVSSARLLAWHRRYAQSVDRQTAVIAPWLWRYVSVTSQSVPRQQKENEKITFPAGYLHRA